MLRAIKNKTSKGNLHYRYTKQGSSGQDHSKQSLSMTKYEQNHARVEPTHAKIIGYNIK